MPTTNGREQVFNEGIKNNDSRPADTTADFLVSQNPDGTQGKIDPVNLPISEATQAAISTVGIISDYSLYGSQQEKYKFYEPERISENPPILSAPVQNGTSTLPDFVFKSTVSGTALSPFFSYFTGEMKRADYSKATDTYSGTFPDYNYVKNIAVTTTSSFGNVAVEFSFDGLAIELVEKGQNARIQILVDEGDGYKRLTHLTQAASPANGSRYLRKLTFPDRRFRKIKVEYSGGYFGGVYVSNGDIVAPVVRRVGKKAIFFGNSFTEGTGGDGAFNGYAAVTGDLLGIEAWMSGSGGTGYINSGPAGRVKFQDRVTRDVIFYSPDIVVIEGGNNDTTQDQSALSTAVNLLISTIKTALPSTTIYVLSNFQLQGSTTNIVNTRNTIKAAALANSVFFIDVIDGVSYTSAGVAINQSSGSWITGSGSISDIKLSGNASTYVAADKAHPSIDGHRYIGNRLALEMSRLSGSDFFNTAGTSAPEYPAYALNLLTGFSPTTGAISGTDTVLQGIQKNAGNLGLKQDALVSGTNIKTVNGNSLLGSGNLVITGSSDIQDIVDATTKTGLVDTGNSQISVFEGSIDNRTFSVIVSPGVSGSSFTMQNNATSLINEVSGGGLVGGFIVNLGDPKMSVTKPGVGTTEVICEEPIAGTVISFPAMSAGNYKVAMQTKEYLVSALPTPTGSDSRFAIVTDALAPAYMATIVGGGSVVCPVFWNGSAWVAN